MWWEWEIVMKFNRRGFVGGTMGSVLAACIPVYWKPKPKPIRTDQPDEVSMIPVNGVLPPPNVPYTEILFERMDVTYPGESETVTRDIASVEFFDDDEHERGFHLFEDYAILWFDSVQPRGVTNGRTFQWVNGAVRIKFVV
jgi:hypothetical protein